MSSFLNALLRGTDWAKLTTFVSPEFFAVVPTVGMIKEAGKLAKSGRKIQLGLSTKNAAQELARKAVVESAELDPHIFAVLIYFAQLMHMPTSIVDLRFSTFRMQSDSADRWEWSPANVIVEWNTDFLENVRNLYFGFYLNDSIRFKKAIENLGLGPAEQQLWRHFGQGEQKDVKFSLRQFQHSFQDVFVACKTHGLTLHPQFFSLGAMLVSLYENLERSPRGINVRDLFMRIISIKS